jgi:hypothetical protein
MLMFTYDINLIKLNKIFRPHVTIDTHGLKIQGKGYLKFLPKFLERGQCFQEKLPGGSPISGFIAFLLTSVLKFA